MSPLAPTGSFGSQSRGSSSICTGIHARAREESAGDPSVTGARLSYPAPGHATPHTAWHATARPSSFAPLRLRSAAAPGRIGECRQTSLPCAFVFRRGTSERACSHSRTKHTPARRAGASSAEAKHSPPPSEMAVQIRREKKNEQGLFYSPSKSEITVSLVPRPAACPRPPRRPRRAVAAGRWVGMRMFRLRAANLQLGSLQAAESDGRPTSCRCSPARCA